MGRTGCLSIRKGDHENELSVQESYFRGWRCKRKILKNSKRVGGTSAGAINAVLLALDYSLEDTMKILSELNFNNFMDDSWGFVRDTKRLIKKYGWYKGNFFRSWMGNLICEKTGSENSTFNDLRNQKFRDLFLIGTNLSTQFAEVFSIEHTPRMRVVDAVRISMSIPLFFTAVHNVRGDVYVDGGVFNNYPIKLFDREKYIKKSELFRHGRKTEYYDPENKRIKKTSSKYVYNKETLGFRLDTGREIAMFRDGAEPQHEKINDFFDYAWALVKSIMNAQDNQHLHSDDWHRTVYINTMGVNTTDFDLKDEEKKGLVKEGTNCVRKYFDWYDLFDPNDRPINHPDFTD
jgi:NTE family protein